MGISNKCKGMSNELRNAPAFYKLNPRDRARKSLKLEDLIRETIKNTEIEKPSLDPRISNKLEEVYKFTDANFKDYQKVAAELLPDSAKSVRKLIQGGLLLNGWKSAKTSDGKVFYFLANELEDGRDPKPPTLKDGKYRGTYPASATWTRPDIWSPRSRIKSKSRAMMKCVSKYSSNGQNMDASKLTDLFGSTLKSRTFPEHVNSIVDILKRFGNGKTETKESGGATFEVGMYKHKLVLTKAILSSCDQAVTPITRK